MGAGEPRASYDPNFKLYYRLEGSLDASESQKDSLGVWACRREGKGTPIGPQGPIPRDLDLAGGRQGGEAGRSGGKKMLALSQR